MDKEDGASDDDTQGTARFPVLPSLIALQQMRNRLETAKHGRRLMLWSAMATGAELRKISQELSEGYRTFSEDVANAFILLARCRFYYENLNRMVLENVPSQACVTIGKNVKYIAGCRTMMYGVERNCPDSYPYLGIEKGGTVIEETKKAWYDLLFMLIRAGQLRGNFRSLEDSYSQNTKRSNVLGKIIIPRTQVTIRYILSELEELEREEFFRLKKVLQVKYKRKKGVEKLEEKVEDEFDDDVCCSDCCSSELSSDATPLPDDKTNEANIGVSDFKQNIYAVVATTETDTTPLPDDKANEENIGVSDFKPNTYAVVATTETGTTPLPDDKTNEENKAVSDFKQNLDAVLAATETFEKAYSETEGLKAFKQSAERLKSQLMISGPPVTDEIKKQPVTTVATKKLEEEPKEAGPEPEPKKTPHADSTPEPAIEDNICPDCRNIIKKQGGKKSEKVNEPNKTATALPLAVSADTQRVQGELHANEPVEPVSATPSIDSYHETEGKKGDKTKESAPKPKKNLQAPPEPEGASKGICCIHCQDEIKAHDTRAMSRTRINKSLHGSEELQTPLAPEGMGKDQFCPHCLTLIKSHDKSAVPKTPSIKSINEIEKDKAPPRPEGARKGRRCIHCQHKRKARDTRDMSSTPSKNSLHGSDFKKGDKVKEPVPEPKETAIASPLAVSADTQRVQGGLHANEPVEPVSATPSIDSYHETEGKKGDRTKESASEPKKNLQARPEPEGAVKGIWCTPCQDKMEAYDTRAMSRILSKKSLHESDFKKRYKTKESAPEPKKNLQARPEPDGASKGICCTHCQDKMKAPEPKKNLQARPEPEGASKGICCTHCQDKMKAHDTRAMSRTRIRKSLDESDELQTPLAPEGVRKDQVCRQCSRQIKPHYKSAVPKTPSNKSINEIVQKKTHDKHGPKESHYGPQTPHDKHASKEAYNHHHGRPTPYTVSEDTVCSGHASRHTQDQHLSKGSYHHGPPTPTCVSEDTLCPHQMGRYTHDKRVSEGSPHHYGPHTPGGQIETFLLKNKSEDTLSIPPSTKSPTPSSWKATYSTTSEASRLSMDLPLGVFETEEITEIIQVRNPDGTVSEKRRLITIKRKPEASQDNYSRKSFKDKKVGLVTVIYHRDGVFKKLLPVSKSEYTMKSPPIADRVVKACTSATYCGYDHDFECITELLSRQTSTVSENMAGTVESNCRKSAVIV